MMDTTLKKGMLKKDEAKPTSEQRTIAPASGLFGRKMGETGKPKDSDGSDREPMNRAA